MQKDFADVIKLGYEDEIIPDYQGGPDIITMVLIRGTKEAQIPQWYLSVCVLREGQPLFPQAAQQKQKHLDPTAQAARHAERPHKPLLLQQCSRLSGC